jgi:multiple sugar transport system permease protein
MNSKNYGRSVLRYVLVIIVTLFAIFPTYWMVTMAFKPLAEWTSAGGVIYWWPQNPTLENFQKLLSSANSQFFSASSFYAWPAIRSSAIVSVGGTLFAMIIGVFAAYGLSRYDDSKGDFPWYIALGRLGVLVVALMPLMLLWSRLNIINTWYGIASIVIIGIFVDDLIARVFGRFYSGSVGNLAFSILQLRMFPPIAIIIPVMIMWAALRMVDTWYGLVIIYGVVTFAFVVWLMKSFFDEVPRELDEAAIVDGASYWGAFFKVVLPLAKGGVAATALFVFILNWSDFLVALFLTNRKWVTIPVFLNRLATAETGTQYGPKAALGVIALIPVLLFGIMIQKYLVRGLTFGAVKK